MLSNFTKITRVLRAKVKLNVRSESTATQDPTTASFDSRVVEVKNESKTVTSPLSSSKKTSSSLTVTKKTPITFAQMFKESQFVNLGDMENKYLIGKIVDIVGDDMYIDYGGKFNCVCKIPLTDIKNPDKDLKNLIKRNMNVKVKLKSFEMASYFLNSAKHISLLESDAEFCSLFDPFNKEDNEGNVTINVELLQKSIDELNSDPYY